MEEQNLAVLRRVVDEIWNRGNLDAANLMFTADYVNHGGLIIDMVRGPEAIKVSVGLYRLAFPDFQITIKELIADGDTVRLSWIASSASDPSASPSEHPDPLTGTMICRFVGGSIAESWSQWDQRKVLEKMGVVTPDTST